MIRHRRFQFVVACLLIGSVNAIAWANDQEAEITEKMLESESNLKSKLIAAESELTELMKAYGKDHPKVKSLDAALKYLRSHQKGTLEERAFHDFRLRRIKSLLDQISHELKQLEMDAEARREVHQSLRVLYRASKESAQDYERRVAEQLRKDRDLRELAAKQQAEALLRMEKEMKAKVQAAKDQVEAHRRQAEAERKQAEAMLLQARKADKSDVDARVRRVEAELSEIKQMLKQLLQKSDES